MKIAILTTEGRDYYRRYQEVTPTFGTAPDALLQGFAQLPEIQVHVGSCAQQPMKSPSKLAENIFFHEPGGAQNRLDAHWIPGLH